MGHIIIAVTMCFFFIQGFFTNLPKCEFPCFFSLGYFQDWFQVFVTSLPLTKKYLGSDLLWANILPTKTTESFKNDHGFRMVESFPKSKGKKTRVPWIQNQHPKSLLKIEARNTLFELCAISKKQSLNSQIAQNWLKMGSLGTNSLLLDENFVTLWFAIFSTWKTHLFQHLWRLFLTDSCIVRNVFALRGGRSDHDGVANGEALHGRIKTQNVGGQWTTTLSSSDWNKIQTSEDIIVNKD